MIPSFLFLFDARRPILASKTMLDLSEWGYPNPNPNPNHT